MTEQALIGLYCCAQTLIPSLFPFMVLSEFLSEYGVFDKLAFVFSPLCTKVLKLPPVAGGAVIMSMVGGFPVGSACCARLYSKGSLTQKQACRMLRFTVGAGPAFVIFAVGQNMLKSVNTGVILYISQVLSQLTIAVLGGLLSKERIVKNSYTKKSKICFSDALIQSCFKSSDSIIKLCAVVVLFSALMGVLLDTGFIGLITRLLNLLFIPKPIADSLLFALTEVTSACRESAKNGTPLEFIAFAIGFGGLSVHFQIFSLLTELDFSKLDFMLHRLLSGVLCAVYTFAITLFFPIEAKPAISLSAPSEIAFSSSTFAGSTALIICCVVFVISIRSKKKNNTISKITYNIKRSKAK
ncbi:MULTISPECIES: nucleoside recognition domain-containing protein [unclassified Ruminococcus]|uniref:nucleoside recognition domain-containing protein n=1 Tax=unclassified Ruminococcus TaxID=2608920 RepID=UPI002109C383|nr:MULTISPECIES: nucleoside recognition domain-containing protein [unclassified Ruminococcus]MCQ4021899.1 hypothetical protein [Ruminococcus sp. zg-924]MCQ4114344.1 hypothetical protein [Ruminococcus sp. zg-921]